jgi:hypothetical protein
LPAKLGWTKTAPGKTNGFNFMNDRRQPHDLPASRYVWLPLKLRPDGAFTIYRGNQWNFQFLRSPEKPLCCPQNQLY